VLLTSGRARELFAARTVARLATADAHGQPHLVPMVFVVLADVIYSVIDAKPKSGRPLRRLANIERNPLVSVLADHYADDWSQLWWARADGSARILELTEPAAALALERLAERYPQYRLDPPPGPMIAIEVARWSGWAAAPNF
jgi:PPOX class probable F420-dependent enzyme